MSSERLHRLSEPLQPPTSAERTVSAIRKVMDCRDLEQQLALRLIAAVDAWREHRNAGRHDQAEIAGQEIENLAAASRTAEWLVKLAEAAHRRVMTGLAALALFFAASFAPSAHAYELHVDEAGQPLHWTAPVVIRVDPALESMLPGAREAITAAAAEWSKAPNSPSIKVSLWPARHGEAIESAAVLLMPRHHFQRGELAITNVNPDATGEIQNGAILINESIRWSADYVTPADAYDFQSVVSHELGHLLGLDESAVETATMFGSLNKGDATKRDLEADDHEGIRVAYEVAPVAIGGCSAAGRSNNASSLLTALGFIVLVILVQRWRRRALLWLEALEVPSPDRPMNRQDVRMWGRAIVGGTARFAAWVLFWGLALACLWTVAS